MTKMPSRYAIRAITAAQLVYNRTQGVESELPFAAWIESQTSEQGEIDQYSFASQVSMWCEQVMLDDQSSKELSIDDVIDICDAYVLFKGILESANEGRKLTADALE